MVLKGSRSDHFIWIESQLIKNLYTTEEATSTNSESNINSITYMELLLKTSFSCLLIFIA